MPLQFNNSRNQSHRLIVFFHLKRNLFRMVIIEVSLRNRGGFDITQIFNTPSKAVLRNFRSLFSRRTILISRLVTSRNESRNRKRARGSVVEGCRSSHGFPTAVVAKGLHENSSSRRQRGSYLEFLKSYLPVSRNARRSFTP